MGQQPPESALGSEVDGAILAAWVEARNFSTTRLRPGYDIEEVDAFANAIRDTFVGIREPSLTPDEIRTKQFATTRLRPGYDEEEVDAFLDEAELRLAAVRGTKDTIGQYGRVLADSERMHGRDHPDTIAARASLASAFRAAGKLKDAVGQYERVLADSERILGAGDPETLTIRCNLATAYYTMGRLPEAVAVFQRALVDCERYLGPDHQMTQTVRENLDAATQS